MGKLDTNNRVHSGKTSRIGAFMNSLKWFRNETSGNVAMLYALTLIPTIGAAGAAVDMGRAVVVKMRLSEALDAAGLSVGATPGLTATEIQQRAQKFFDANYPAAALGETANLTATLTGNVVKISATAKVQTAFMGLMGIDEINVASSAEITRENKGMEIALSLDNTGSMASSGKLTALKQASTDLVNILFGDSANPEKLKVGIVPFSMTVRLDTTMATSKGWMDATGTALWAKSNFNNSNYGFSVWSTMSQSSWGGCVEARPNGLEELDTAPSAATPNTRWVPFFQPDEPDNPPYSGYGANYLSDAVTGVQDVRLKNAAKYVGKKNSNPNMGCSMQKIQPLTNSKATLLTQISGMQATGLTHVALGAAWGWRVLSPGEPFTEGAAYDDPEWQKALVLMTDGVNTVGNNSTFHKSSYTAYGYLSQSRLGTTNASVAVSNQNSRTATVCTNMKAVGIRIYTILLMENDTTTVNMMKNCATSPELYFNSPTAGALQGVFQAIANDLSNLRLSK